MLDPHAPGAPSNDWDALHSLEFLSPPSPILTTADFNTTTLSASGDILIRLSCIVCDIPNGGDDCLDSPRAIFNADSESALSIISCGTFDPKYSKLECCDVFSAASWDAEVVNTPPTISACSTTQRPSPIGGTNGTIRRSNSSSKLLYLTTQSDCPSDLAQARSTTSLGFLSVSRSESHSPARPSYARSRSTEALSASARYHPNRYSNTFNLFDSSWSTMSGFLSPSLSAACHNVVGDQDTCHFITPITSLRGVKDRRPYRTPIPRSPPIVRLPIHPTISRPRKVSDDNDSTGHPDPSRSKHPLSPLSLPRWHSAPNLPPVLDWLENAVVELRLDQEGFRSVHPRFKPSGFTTKNQIATVRDAGLLHALACGLVEFRPIKRYIFAFHYSTLESSPMLRRLTMAGEVAKDYLTRQASLCIKQNGVYAVRGTEDSDLCASTLASHRQTDNLFQEHGQFKYDWRFEYVVNDRKDSAGKTIQGEKMLTPLSFACSPGLLHPIFGTGKKRTIMQQVKKVFAAKVAAEQMHAPIRPGAIWNQQASRPRPIYAISDVQRKTARPTHRRFHSATAIVTIVNPIFSTTPSPNMNQGRASPSICVTRNRSTSIAELPPTPTEPSFPSLPEKRDPPESLGSAERHRSLTSPVFKVVRHIIPPAQSDDMFITPLENFAIHTTRRASPRLGSAAPLRTSHPHVMTALAPPRHYHPPQQLFPTSPLKKSSQAQGLHDDRKERDVPHRIPWRS